MHGRQLRGRRALGVGRRRDAVGLMVVRIVLGPPATAAVHRARLHGDDAHVRRGRRRTRGPLGRVARREHTMPRQRLDDAFGHAAADRRGRRAGGEGGALLRRRRRSGTLARPPADGGRCWLCERAGVGVRALCACRCARAHVRGDELRVKGELGGVGDTSDGRQLRLKVGKPPAMPMSSRAQLRAERRRAPHRLDGRGLRGVRAGQRPRPTEQSKFGVDASDQRSRLDLALRPREQRHGVRVLAGVHLEHVVDRRARRKRVARGMQAHDKSKRGTCGNFEDAREARRVERQLCAVAQREREGRRARRAHAHELRLGSCIAREQPALERPACGSRIAREGHVCGHGVDDFRRQRLRLHRAARAPRRRARAQPAVVLEYGGTLKKKIANTPPITSHESLLTTGRPPPCPALRAAHARHSARIWTDQQARPRRTPF